MRNSTVQLLLTITVCGALALPAAAANDKRETCVGVTVGSAQQLAPANGPGQSGKDPEEEQNDRQFNGDSPAVFSATNIIDLDFAVLLEPSSRARFAADSGFVEFRIFTPSGQLYQSLTVPFTGDTKRKGQKLRVAGYPDVVPVRVLGSVTHKKVKSILATARMPVAGTPIINNSLYGRWTAEARLNDDASPCSTPAQFTIQP